MFDFVVAMTRKTEIKKEKRKGSKESKEKEDKSNSAEVH
jgi:hypothetical protein